MYKETIENIKDLIQNNEIKEVITSTNGTRKVIIQLFIGPPLVYYGNEALEVLTTTNRY